MTVTNRKAENDLVPQGRIALKNSNIVVRIIHSESGKVYHVTFFEGRVSCCEQANGEPCKGWRYRHSCHHATLATQLEVERAQVLEEQHQEAAQTVEAAVEYIRVASGTVRKDSQTRNRQKGEFSLFR